MVAIAIGRKRKHRVRRHGRQHDFSPGQRWSREVAAGVEWGALTAGTKRLHFRPIVAIWRFPKIGVPPNGWLSMENPSKIDDLGRDTHFRKPPSIQCSLSILVRYASLTWLQVPKCQSMQTQWAHAEHMSGEEWLRSLWCLDAFGFKPTQTRQNCSGRLQLCGISRSYHWVSIAAVVCHV